MIQYVLLIFVESCGNINNKMLAFLGNVNVFQKSNF